ncbi:MAG: TIGR04282 family arsenosugar biosynthesis glycosyltransferase [Pseudomonadales bacterium]
MSYLFPDSIIQIFCKAPIAGEVKTRLIADMGGQAAARLHERLARHTIALCQGARLAPVEIWCTPDTDHDFFAGAADESTLLCQQRGSDLGERLANAAASALGDKRAEAVVIIGTDCPGLDADYLRLALEKLEDHDAVVGPAEDGGYCLIGLRHGENGLIQDKVFRNIPWGTDTVCADTCRILNHENLRWALLPLLWDVDRPEDVARLDNPVIDQTLGAG